MPELASLRIRFLRIVSRVSLPKQIGLKRHDTHWAAFFASGTLCKLYLEASTQAFISATS
jgi:hypothetical protein